MLVPIATQHLPASCIDAAPATSDESTLTLIWAHMLIPGRGSPVQNGAVAIRGNKIEWVGEFQHRPHMYQAVRPICVHVLMPGLWDCHTHFLALDVACSINMGSAVEFLPGYAALAGAITVDDLRVTLNAGYTSVRELCGFAGDIWPAVKNGALVGPNIYSSIGMLSTTAGHGDEHSLPMSLIADVVTHGGRPMAICDGVPDCIKTVRKMVRRGARVIKISSSGGVISLNDDPEDRQFSDDELRAIVEEAGRSRRAVAAHAIGKAGIMAGLRAGVKTIEHGFYLDEEVADFMIEKDAILVPTQHIVRVLKTDYPDLPEPVRRKLNKLHDQSRTAYKLAIKKGVKIAMGTDTASSDRKSRLSHGRNAHELVYAVELGMTPLQAIESATAIAPETLGCLAPLSGQLKAGFDADLIAIRENPLEDINVLTDADNITHVWKGGKLHKKL
ncbi:hypothetical protein E4U21_005838 [Claviceps maximensis]|nr:hypothetical protein E4U21_005838 [Claviceps maximensis]